MGYGVVYAGVGDGDGNTELCMGWSGGVELCMQGWGAKLCMRRDGGVWGCLCGGMEVGVQSCILVGVGAIRYARG